MIAAFVVFAFLSLLQISAMPAAPSPSAETSMASSEKAPGFIEEEGSTAYQTKKKSMLPIVLIGVGVVAVAAVLFLVVLKTKYDITGQWQLEWDYPGYNSGEAPITFSGDKKSGTFVIGTANGTYAVDGKKVTWTYTGGDTVYTGEFSDKTHMSGTIVSNGIPGTWTAVKLGATSGFGNMAAAGNNANGKVEK
jgi:hypothetical protein